jgi:cytochrome c oxidase subunit IV
MWALCPVAVFTKLRLKRVTKILTIILSVKIVLTLRVILPCHKCKILNVREIFVSSFIVSEKIEKKDGRCIGASV